MVAKAHIVLYHCKKRYKLCGRIDRLTVHSMKNNRVPLFSRRLRHIASDNQQTFKIGENSPALKHLRMRSGYAPVMGSIGKSLCGRPEQQRWEQGLWPATPFPARRRGDRYALDAYWEGFISLGSQRVRCVAMR